MGWELYTQSTDIAYTIACSLEYLKNHTLLHLVHMVLCKLPCKFICCGICVVCICSLLAVMEDTF